MTDCTVFGIAK